MRRDSGTGNEAPCLAIYDLVGSGHHRMYLESMIAWWLGQGNRATGMRLDVWVPPSFLEQHPDFSDLHSSDHVRIRLLPEASDPQRRTNATLPEISAMNRKALQTILESSPRHVMSMFLDHAQWAVRAFRRSAIPISGILFRSQLGYPMPGWKGRLVKFRKKVLLQAALPAMTHVFCLDPYEAERINALTRVPKAVHLPDGVPPLPSVPDRSELRGAVGLNPADHVAFMGGSLSLRKGIRWLSDAVSLLSESEREGLVLAFVGAIPAGQKDAVTEAIASMRDSVRVIVEEGYATEQRLAEWWSLSDSTLVPYEGHVGSSHVLLRSAQLGKPVVGVDHQLLGRWIKDHHLGIACPPGDARALRHALVAIRSQSVPGFDRDRARSFGSDFTLDRMFSALSNSFPVVA